MNWYKLYKAAGFTLAAFICTAQALHAQTKDTVLVKQAKGDMKIAKNPGRVVVLDLGSLETCYELGIPVAGVLGNITQFMPEYGDTSKFTVAGNVTKADLTIVASLKPDLIITSNRQSAQHDSLAMIAPTLVFSTDINNFWETFEANVRNIALIFGKEELAEQKLAALHQKVDIVREKTKSDNNKAVFALHVSERFNPSGPNSRFGFGYDILGLQPAYTPEPAKEDSEQGEKSKTPAPSLESINPDYLFLFDRATGIKGTMPALSDLLNDDIRRTNAYKNNKVFLLPGSIWYLSGSGLLSVSKKITDVGEMLYGIKF